MNNSCLHGLETQKKTKMKSTKTELEELKKYKYRLVRDLLNFVYYLPDKVKKHFVLYGSFDLPSNMRKDEDCLEILRLAQSKIEPTRLEKNQSKKYLSILVDIETILSKEAVLLQKQK